LNNAEIVQGIYAAFGRRDVPWILERLAADVAWEYAYADEGVPWLAPRHGRDGARAFFESLVDFQIEKFAVNHILSQGSLVVALISLEGFVPRTGRRIIETDEVHLWHFNESHQVQRFRHVVDTLQHFRAWNADPQTA
jgi:ketosteroid isomerase-like protein